MSKKLRFGYTTGSCAAACSKAATIMLLSGKKTDHINIMTPKGIVYDTDIKNITMSGDGVSCFVVKDGGDDPDATHGTLVGVYVTTNVPQDVIARKDVCLFQNGDVVDERTGRIDTNNIGGNQSEKSDPLYIYIDGGIGVGRVTKPGLDQTVGASAINHVPREMIAGEVTSVCETMGYRGSIYVEVRIPEGETIAEHTFNPRLGIVGGISVLGTTGIVEPMSMQALLDTTEVEMRVHKESGEKTLVIAPGNYGQDFLKDRYGYDLDTSVKISNYVGAALDLAADCGFESVLLLGHIGKMIKLAGGIMNTHSHEADCRIDLLISCGIRAGLTAEEVKPLIDEVTTDGALEHLRQIGKLEPVMQVAMERICYYLNKKVAGRYKIDCMMYSNEYGLLGASEDADRVLRQLGHRED